MAEVSEGSVVDGRYRVLQKLGSGGMADVWLAEDTHLQRRVALKVLHSRFAQDREFVERFRREAEHAAGLQHPNVVAVFDRGEVEGAYYIAMQYVEGNSLKALIDAGLSPEQAVHLVRQVLEAARFAHRHGIVHRDLKPQNVIVNAEGVAVVTDFGIARAGVSEITQAGSVMGTPHYLSPEQAQGMDVTPVSDLYSVGVILYEALTGTGPVRSGLRRRDRDETGFPNSAATQLDRPEDLAGPRRGRDARAGEGPGSALPERRRFHRGARRGDEGARARRGAGPQPSLRCHRSWRRPSEDEVEERREEERRWNRRWLLVLLAILIGALLGFALTRDNTTEVPSVTGNQLSVAISLLQQDGFEVGEVNRVERDAPLNTVLEQDPAASPPGKQAELDCAFLTLFCSKPEVTLTVSAGPGSAKVPSVAGLKQDVALRKLRDAGFAPQLQTVNSETVEAGLVIRSDPSGGTTLTRGSPVTVFVSLGKKLVKVPVLVGTQRSVAVQQIRGRGLTPSVEEEESSAPAGEVIRQSPSAGSEVEPGSTISIVVSRGEEQVSVPNVIGRLRADAVQALRDAGLVPSVQEQETDVPSQVGRVTDQFPPPGSNVTSGTEVNVVVGKQASGSVTTPTTPESP